MTAPATGTVKHRFLRPAVALPVIAAAVIVVALLTPEATGGRSGDARLTSMSTEPQGAAALYELADRLGWQTSQRLTDSIPLGDSSAVHLQDPIWVVGYPSVASTSDEMIGGWLSQNTDL